MLSAPVLVAAYGSWEPVPDASAHRQQAHRASDLFAFKANFTETSLESGLLPYFLSQVVTGAWWWTAMQAQYWLSACAAIPWLTAGNSRDCKAAQAALAYVAQRCPGVGNVLAGARQCDGWLSVALLWLGIRIRRRGEGAFLVGNAAGEAHPVVGEGISMAIQSAWLLVHILAPYRKQISDMQLQASLQKKYAHAWRQHFAARIHLAAVFAHCAMRVALVDFLLPLLKCYPQVLTYAAQWSGKTRSVPCSKLFYKPSLNEGASHDKL